MVLQKKSKEMESPKQESKEAYIKLSTVQCTLAQAQVENKALTKKKEVEGLRGELEQVRGAMEGVRGELEGTRREMEGVKGELKQVRGEMEGVKGELEGTRGQLEERNARVLELERQVQTLRDSELKLIEKLDHEKGLNQELALAKEGEEHQLEQYKKCISDVEGEVVVLTSDNEDLKEQVRIKEAQVDDLQQLAGARGEELEQLAAQLEASEQANAEMNAACAKLRVSLEQTFAEVTSLQQRLSEQGSLYANVDALLTKKDETIRRLEQELMVVQTKTSERMGAQRISIERPQQAPPLPPGNNVDRGTYDALQQAYETMEGYYKEEQQQKEKGELEGTRGQLEERNARVLELERQVQTLRDSEQKLIEKLDHEKGLNRELASAKEGEEHQLEQYKKCISDVEGEVVVLTSENKDLKEQVRIKEAQVDDLQQLAGTRGEELEQLAAQLEASKQANAEMDAACAELRVSLEQTFAEVTSLQQRLSEQGSLYANVDALLTEKDETIRRLEQELMVAQTKTSERMGAQRTSIERPQQAPLLPPGNTVDRGAYDALQQAYETMEGYYKEEQQQKEKGELEGTRGQLEERNARVLELERQVQTLRDSELKLIEKLDPEKGLNRELTSAKEGEEHQLEQYKKCISDVEGEVVVLTSENEDLKEQVRIKEAQVDDLQQLAGARGEELEQLAAQLEASEQVNAEMNAACAELRVSLEQTFAEVTSLQQRLSEQGSLHTNVDALLTEKDETIKRLEQELMVAQANISELMDAEGTSIERPQQAPPLPPGNTVDRGAYDALQQAYETMEGYYKEEQQKEKVAKQLKIIQETSKAQYEEMAQRVHEMQAQGKTFHYQHYRLFRNATLGTGAYGMVCKAKLDELPCAAKLLHPILVDGTDPKNQTNLRKFEQECCFLSKIRHPNIVQYLAVVQDRESGLPVLFMELMDTSLTHFLEQSEKPLSYHVQVDISHDIALALAYLHSNDIIHRDLSSNNVLLIGPGYRAKVTDFGMSKLSEMHSHMTPLTKCPSTAAYMAPEALQNEPVYSAKLDMFQAGVLMIQIITRKFPDPDRATRRINDPRYPTGMILVPVPETERRQNHLRLIPQTHPMLRLSLDCLKVRDEERPTAQQICQQLFTLKEAPPYVQSHQEREGEGTGGDGEKERERVDGERMRQVEERETEVERREREVVRKEREIEEREREMERKLERREEGIKTSRERENVALANLHQLEDKDQTISEKTQELQRKNEELREKTSQLHEKNRIINEKTREVQRKDDELQEKTSQLHEKDLIIDEKVQELQGKDEELHEKDRVIDERTRELQRKKEEIGRVMNKKTQELQVKDEELQKKDHMIKGKTCELQGKDEELRAKIHEIGREDMLLLKRKRVQKSLLATLCLTVVVVGVCVAKLFKQDWNITQLQSSVSEKVQIITQLRRSFAEKEWDNTQLERSLAQKEWNITQLQSSLKEKEQIIAQLQWSLIAASYTCHVSGPGLSATANYPTHVIVELSDASGQPCSLRQHVTAELQSVDQSSVVPTTVSVRSPSQYEVSYTALSRGQHKLHVRLNSSEVSGSPFNITVYPDPTQLGTPVRVVTGLNKPYGIAINSHGEMVVSNWGGHTVSLLDSKGEEIQTYGSWDDRPDQMIHPTDVAVDSDDNVYVASQHKLQKFSRDGHLIKCVGQKGSKDGDFRQPIGVGLHHGHVYVCDRDNDDIQVFDTDLNFIRTIGSPGSGRGQFNEPRDLDFDSEGKAYISDKLNHRIQVIDTSDQFVRQFGQEEGEGKLKWPTAVHVVGQFVYVSDWGLDRIAVYQTSGHFVTSFGHQGKGEGEFNEPYGITSDENCFVYVVDLNNHRVQIF